MSFDEIGWKLLELIIIPIIVVYFYDFFTFWNFFSNLCDEINQNFDKIQKDRIELELEAMREKLDKRMANPINDPPWIGFDKTILVWILSSKK